MSIYDELDLLDQAQTEAEQIADEMGFATDVDRRKFVFMSLADRGGDDVRVRREGARSRRGRRWRRRPRRAGSLPPRRCRSTIWKRSRGRFSRIRAARARC